MTGEAAHCGFCAIIGAPNAGKSTLVNQLAGSKVSIVSRKAQTTRARIRAITVEGNTQIVFVDTPGIFAPRRKLDTAMVANAWSGAGEADAVLLIVDARKGLDDEVRTIIAGLGDAHLKPALVLNKIDAISRDKLLPLTEALTALYAFPRVFMVSAINGDGVAELKSYIAAQMPEGPWLYPGDQTADIQLRFLASEITREKLYERLHDELPYASTVETESWEERRDGSVRIGQVIFVERDSQKMIVLGKGGQTIKQIGQLARTELEALFERKVHLFLFVKVRENWAEDPERLRNMGLDL
ncbi:MAG: GTPase Era [Rhizobiales bacterium]|nr:GTPase Era [Hyphomicrobiales bacterium]